ncbi:MAG: hypothetical protein COB77_04285 [Gammaproteobacteria bacterium]|nr:MAG: hypothetical protein COB77_04285 [Gammaproteobacteria bacterium]
MLGNLLTKILGALALLAGLFGLYQKRRAESANAEARRQTGRANSAQAHSDTHQRVNKARDSIQQKQKQEQTDAQERLDDGHRDHFDNNG